MRDGKIADYRYKLLPIFSNLIPADRAMAAHIDKVRAPFAAKLAEPLAVTEATLYRRGNFNGTFDQVIVDALMSEMNAEIAFSPGFRWGTSLLPGQSITYERLLDQTAITYPYVTRSELSGETIKTILEDVCDNLFNPDPYYQQGGDMVRVGGLQYTCDPAAAMGSRISAMTLGGKPIDAGKNYVVAGWAPVAEQARDSGAEPIWDLMARYLRAQKTIRAAPAQPAAAGRRRRESGDRRVGPRRASSSGVLRARTCACRPGRRRSFRPLSMSALSVTTSPSTLSPRCSISRSASEVLAVSPACLHSWAMGSAVPPACSVTSGISVGQRVIAKARLERRQRALRRVGGVEARDDLLRQHHLGVARVAALGAFALATRRFRPSGETTGARSSATSARRRSTSACRTVPRAPR